MENERRNSWRPPWRMYPNESAEQIFERRFDAIIDLLEDGLFSA